MPLGKSRRKVLYGLSAMRSRIHRYTAWRWLVGVTFTLAIACLPLAGILRFDMWGGHHVVMGKEATLVEAAKAFAFPFLAVNVVIIIASRFIGRYLCGFVCPVGSLARLDEWFRWRSRKGNLRLLPAIALLSVSFFLAAITFSFWVDWRVFLEGSTFARTVSGVFLGGMTLGLFGLVHGLGLRFCREYCPSGVYFAVLGPKTSNGVEFANPDSCTDCKACEAVCPMDLQPREMEEGDKREGMGFYPESMTNYALCIRCGDCISACEGTTSRDPEPTPLRMGWLDENRAAPDQEHAPTA